MSDFDKAYLLAIVSTMHGVYKTDKVILLLLLWSLAFNVSMTGTIHPNAGSHSGVQLISNNTKVTKQLLQVQFVMISTGTCFPDKDQPTSSS